MSYDAIQQCDVCGSNLTRRGTCDITEMTTEEIQDLIHDIGEDDPETIAQLQKHLDLRLGVPSKAETDALLIGAIEGSTEPAEITAEDVAELRRTLARAEARERDLRTLTSALLDENARLRLALERAQSRLSRVA